MVRASGLDSADELPDLLIGGRREVVVPQPDRAKILWRLRTDDPIGVLPQSPAGVGRANRRRRDDCRRSELTQPDQRGFHRRACGEAVVHDDDRSIPEIGTRSRASILSIPTIELESLTHRDLLDHRSRDAQVSNETFVKHFNAALGDGSHRQLRMTGHTQLPDEKDIERRTEVSRDFGRHGNPASREPQDNHVGSSGIGAQLSG